MFLALIGWCFAGAFVIHSCGCTPQQARTAVDVGVKVASDTCDELEDAGVTGDDVALACDAAPAIGGVVQVLLPRRTWLAMKTDAGPGK